ncbi:FMN-dependent NADH-azoreductase [Novosphingobium sp. 1748]|uniref:FMN-dependent NADH-azoreductase n=1 Tax=Novosphingobium sp. 1748 TaxID=2817760 RepID=UPI0028546786|nr:NAD(P)H-dependent oxidoreductase [Novosphingobium sp. 1748]MDR6710146.1 FMN-dependent NADH-azoreductase [Novosphingobium sp. 1748]
MQQILLVEASPRGVASASRTAADHLMARLTARHPAAKLVRRDLAAQPLPQPDAAMLAALAAPEPSAASALSDRLVAELLASDCLVIATPLWNFGIPSALKAWVDLVVRAGKTFQYAADGVTGLAQGKRALVLIASGGVFSEGPWAEWDGAVPYLRRILGFIGITQVEVVRIEGLNIPDLAGRAVPAALEHIDTLAI